MATGSKRPRLITVVGPTAASKTELSIALAHRVGGAVVSADSRQVYAQMNIGTAKPPQAWREMPHDTVTPDIVEDVPHYLLNIHHPDTLLTLAQWQRAAWLAIDRLQATGTRPILSGGTMLYIDSITYNYAIPAVEASSTLRAELAQQDVSALYDALLAHDPAARNFVEPHHKQRIIRALEVMAATGRPFSEQRHVNPPRYDIALVGVFPDWPVLKQRIRTRAQQMLHKGLLEETQQLIERYSENMPLLNTINYAQAHRFLMGNLSREEALEDMVRASMRYAHRQMSWWKSRSDITWITSVSDLEQLLQSGTGSLL
jgi:tRNA dimethylallyltransferase